MMARPDRRRQALHFSKFFLCNRPRPRLSLPALTTRCLAERCQSGRSGRSRKPLYLHGYRGFESHPLRHHPRQAIDFAGNFRDPLSSPAGYPTFERGKSDFRGKSASAGPWPFNPWGCFRSLRSSTVDTGDRFPGPAQSSCARIWPSALSRRADKGRRIAARARQCLPINLGSARTAGLQAALRRRSVRDVRAQPARARRVCS